MKRLVCFALLLSVLVGSPLSAFASNEKTVSTEYYYEGYLDPLEEIAPVNADVHTKLDIKAKSVILMEPYTGRILYEQNGDEKLAPASITKIMSLLLIMESIESGAITLETTVTASEHAASMGGSQIWLEPGEQMSVHELLKASVIASANDATCALAELVAGSEEGFVDLMNKKAQELGMANTYFENCSGLDSDNHLTSAHDVAIMSCELIKYPLIKNYSTVWMDSLRNGQSELVNTNKLVRFYEGATGLKTGTTSKAGYCISASAKRGELELVAVVMGAESTAERFNGARKLLDFGFANWDYVSFEPNLEQIETPSVLKGVDKSCPVMAEKIYVLMNKSSAKNVEQQVELPQTVEAPIKKGQVIGYIHLKLNGEQIGVMEIKAQNDVQKMGFSVALSWLITQLLSL